MLKTLLNYKGFYVRLIFLLIVLGISNYGIIAIVSATIGGKTYAVFQGLELWFFLIFITLLIICQKQFQSFLVIHTNKLIYETEIAILKKVRSSTYQSFEKLGVERIHSVIEESHSLTEAPTTIVTIINSAIVVLCGLVFMCFVSLWGAIGVVVLFFLLATFYSYRQKALVGYFRTIRQEQEKFYRYLHDILRGFKEVKLNRILNDKLFYDHLKTNREKMKSLKGESGVMIVNNEIIGNYSPYILLGAAIFAFRPLLGIGQEEIASFTLVLLYIINPLTELISSLSNYPKLQVIANRINEFHDKLEVDDSFAEHNSIQQNEFFSTLRFENVSFSYRDEITRKEFVLGPVNLELSAGEVVFLTGGNGSGKSTFVKLLTGIYKPSAGNIFLNEIEVPYNEYQRVKELMSAVFTDNHLFSENYLSHDLSSKNELILKYINVMKLGAILKLDGAQIDAKLSKGQQKRLALVYALLDERPIVVLDEWAAEQDPQFRKYFYHEVIAFLRSNGKTVIAVTHDDSYFGSADRLLKFDFGTLGEESQLVMK